MPLHWAMTQNNLGTALWSLGERESGTGKLEEAVAAYREALKERTRERVPLDWAMTQHGLANALATLAKRQKNTPRMKEALACMQRAAEAYGESGESYWLPIAQQRILEIKAELTALEQ